MAAQTDPAQTDPAKHVPRVFTIPPGRPFLQTLARAVLDGHLPEPHGTPRGPLELSDVTLILPTRRSA